MMKSRQNKKLSKAIVDVVLLIGLIACALSSSVFDDSIARARDGADPNDVFSWGSAHCIVAVLFVMLAFLHIWQHWDFIKALIKKRLFSKHKLTTITLIVFIFTVISFLFFLIGFNRINLHNHSFFAHFFVLIVVIHFITRFKLLVLLFKK